MMDFNNLGSSIFATGIGVTLLTKAKEIWSYITKYCHFGYKLYVSTDGNSIAYINLYNYINQLSTKKFQRNTSFDINKDDYCLGIETEDNNISTIVHNGTYLFHPKWYQIIFVEAHTEQKENNYKPNHSLSVKCFGFKAKELQEDIIKEIAENLKEKRQIIYDIKHYDNIFVAKRNFSTIYHQKKEEILQFLDNFKRNKELYIKNGLPYKTGLLLYGPPGTGKTSMIKAIADYMNYSITYVSANTSINAFNIRQNSIVVFEDIDRLLEIEDKGEDKEENFSCILNTEEENKITLLNNKLHTIMQLLDGLFSKDDIIFIATTNHIELLPPELIREGRFDCKIELTDIDKENAQKMCKSFGFELTEVVEKEQKYPINPAYLQKLLLNKLNYVQKI